MKNKIAAVVVTYNRKELLKECLQCLLNQTYAAFDIFVIDNHSTDNTAEYIEELLLNERLHYFDTGSNLGGAGGFSYGIKQAAEQMYEYIWLMDDDCMPNADALAAFISADKELNGEYGFLSGKVLWKDGSICRMNLQRETVIRNLKNFEKRIQPVAMASFVSLFVPTKVVQKLGLPIKEFFIWTDDWEYTRRISRKYKCYAVSDSVAVHMCKSNIGANIATEEPGRLDRFDYLYRNDVYLYRREGLKGLCYEAIRLTGHCVRVMLKSKNNKGRRLAKIINGTKEGLSFRPEIEYIK